MSRLEGQEGLLRRLRAIGEARPLLRALQLETVRQAKLVVPRKTGNLGRSIVPGTVGRDWAEVEARMSYAAAIELGSKPHRITAKPGKVLAWPATAAGRRLSGRANSRALKGSPGLGQAGGGFGGVTIKRVGKKGKTSGTFRYARGVNHPGTKPMPFLMPGAKAALDKAGITVVEQWNKAD
jgi:hypothetical protein